MHIWRGVAERVTLMSIKFVLACALAVFAATAAPSAVRAEDATSAAGKTAAAIHQACVARGEPVAVCACGVGLAYAKLDPKVFALVPQIDPLLDEKDQGRALMSLAMMLQGSGLTVQDGMAAYESIRANRKNVDDICKPLAR